MIGKRHDVENQKQRSEDASGNSDGASALTLELGAGSQISQKQDCRPHDPRDRADRSHDDADDEQAIRHKEQNATEHNNAINGAADSEHRQPGRFSTSQRRAAGFFNSEEIMFGEMFEMLQRALMEIGNLEQV